ncbi:MAG: FAD-dependent oxidoreductase [Erysipelothrix sp.]|nr:FAD-dependent oxidoreductase [Erysipelothrix sp.]
MKKKIKIIGGVAGGASVAARVRRLDEFAEITMFERGPHVSFSNCALPFHLSGIIENSDDLVLMHPEQFSKQYNIEAKVNHEVIAINKEEKTISVKNTLTNEISKEAYDVLVMSPGAKPIRPQSIVGINSEHVFSVRNVPDIAKIQAYIDNNNIDDVVVVGGGFIGLEVMENLRHAGKKVTLVEAAKQVMMPLDEDMAQVVHREIHDKGVELILEDSVVEITDSTVVLSSGKTINSKLVIMAIGVQPETDLAQAANLEIGKTGAIKVNQNYQTSDPSIYAVGDAIEVYHKILRKQTRLSMAGPAQRQARAAADHIYGRNVVSRGVIGSSVLQVFDYAVATTGINETQALEAAIDYRQVYIIPNDKVGLMPDAEKLFFKLIFEYPTGVILGAQAIGKGNADKRIDIIATMISQGGTIHELADLELAYSPTYSTAKDVTNMAALVGLNILNGEYKQVAVSEVRELVENNAYIIDVREEDEFAEGHLINAVNIPLSQFRDRLNEIPKDKAIYLHCRSGQRSYNMVRALNQRGYSEVYNISGSYLGISNYEYFKDQVTNRNKIVTEYNFN